MSDGTKDWYGLGPVSVHPDFQRKGIGKALIQKGLSRLRNLKAKGCCLVGHPEYYRQFGFHNVEGLVHEGVPQEVFFRAMSYFTKHLPQMANKALLQTASLRQRRRFYNIIIKRV
jgi:putative acetyltransferase